MVIIMNKNKLIIQRSIFTLAIIIIFGLIIMNEKGGTLFSKKAKKNITEYVEEKYNSEINYLKIKSPTYNKKVFKSKIISKKNKNYYFYVIYHKGKITDTYKKDYLEGKSILNYLDKKLEKEITTKTKKKTTVHPISKLNNFTEQVQERIINEESLLELKYYYIEYELEIEKWDEKTITEKISNHLNIINKKKITPKYQNITIISKTDITKAIRINNITEELINNKMKNNIINDIINNNNSKLLKENKITYKYLNEEE